MRVGGGWLAVMLAGCALAYAGEAPLPSHLRESVSVDRSVIEVTVWPESGELELCAQLDLDRVEVLVDGAWRTRRTLRELTIDRVGSARSDSSPLDLGIEPPGEEPQWIVLYVDETHFPPCDVPPDASMRRRAFDQARAMIERDFDPARGDRLLIAAYRGGEAPDIATNWLADREQALAALGQLDAAGHAPLAPGSREARMHRWFAALESLVHAIGDPGEVPATKHVLLLAADLPIDARWAEELERLNRDALSVSRTLVHAIDVRHAFSGQEYGLGSLAWNAGGHFWTNGETIGTAVATLKGLARHGCKLLVTLPRRDMRTVRVDVKDARFRAETIIAKGITEPLALARKRLEARALRPAWGRGLALETALWPVRIEDDAIRAVLFARVLLEPGGPTALRLEASVLGATIVDRRPGAPVAAEAESVSEPIEGDALASLLESGSHTFFFEVRVPRGAHPVHRVVVASTDGRHGAARQEERPMSARPSWALIESLAPPDDTTDLLPLVTRHATRVVPVPALDAAIPAHWSANFVGHGCAEEGALTATLVSQDGDEREVPVTAFGERRDGCGWYLAKHAPLPPGTWTFQPPRALGRTPVTFTVTPAAAATARIEAGVVAVSPSTIRSPR